MFNDDPYTRQRPRAGAIGSAPVVNDVVSPKLRRDAAMYAPVTNHFSPSSAAAQLVDARLTRSGQPMPSQMAPMPQRVPSAADPAMPPPAARITPAIPPAAAKLTRAPGPGLSERIGQGLESAAPVFGGAANQAAQETGGGIIARGVRGARTGVLTGLAGIEAATRGAGVALGYTAGEVGTGLGYAQAAPAPTIATPPAATPMPTGAQRTGGRPDLRQAPPVAAAQPAPGAPQQPTPQGTQPVAQPVAQPGANAAAPGQVGLSEKTQQPLPGAPVVGADGSVVYDDKFAERNPELMTRYAGQNVVQSVVPPPPVISRAPGGFTAEDRAGQLDNMDRQGRDYKVRDLNEKSARAASYGEAAKAAALQQAAQTAAIAQPPRITPLTRADPNDAARLAMEQQRLGMDQQSQGLANEQTQVQTQTQKMQLEQAKQAQALTTKLLNGTPEEKQAAAASLAALQGTKPGQPIKVKRQVPTGQVDALGVPVMGEEEMLYIRETGQWLAPPPAAGGAGQPPAQAIDYLKQNDTPQTRAAFQAKYGVDPATILG